LEWVDLKSPDLRRRIFVAINGLFANGLGSDYALLNDLSDLHLQQAFPGDCLVPYICDICSVVNQLRFGGRFELKQFLFELKLIAFFVDDADYFRRKDLIVPNWLISHSAMDISRIFHVLKVKFEVQTSETSEDPNITRKQLMGALRIIP
jgi:hypothetical protein